MKQLRDKAEKFAFQAEVNRMMKLIINSLYRNKEVCTCEEGGPGWVWYVEVAVWGGMESVGVAVGEGREEWGVVRWG